MSQAASVKPQPNIHNRLKELGLELPPVTMPAAAYVPCTLSGNLLFVSGQLPLEAGKPAKTGKLGVNVTLEEGQALARLCAINILAHAKNTLNGKLERIGRVLKLEILVAAAPDFTTPHLVANGASQLFLDLFGEQIGSHARVAYGVSVLPLDVPVEVAATFEIN